MEKNLRKAIAERRGYYTVEGQFHGFCETLTMVIGNLEMVKAYMIEDDKGNMHILACIETDFKFI